MIEILSYLLAIGMGAVGMWLYLIDWKKYTKPETPDAR